MIAKIWNKFNDIFNHQLLVTLPNRYQGLILFVMLLVIYLK